MGIYLNHYVINIAFPAIILLAPFPDRIELDHLNFVAAPWIWMVTTVIFMYYLGSRLNWDRDVRLVAMLLPSTGNTGFFGLPLVRTYFPEEMLFYAVLYDQLVTFFFVAIIVPIAIAIHSSTEGKVTPLNLLVKIITFPPFLAFLVAFFVLPSYPLPAPIVSFANLIADSIIPVGMVGLGLRITLAIHQTHINPLAIALTWKLALMPFCIYLLYSIFGIDGMIRSVGVFQSLMPPSLSGYFLISAANIAPRLAGSIVLIAIGGMFITVPIMLLLIGINFNV